MSRWIWHRGFCTCQVSHRSDHWHLSMTRSRVLSWPASHRSVFLIYFMLCTNQVACSGTVYSYVHILSLISIKSATRYLKLTHSLRRFWVGPDNQISQEALISNVHRVWGNYFKKPNILLFSTSQTRKQC